MRVFGFTCRAYSGEGRWIPRTRLRASATATVRVAAIWPVIAMCMRVAVLDALAFERTVDARWTSSRSRANAFGNSDSKPYRRRTHRRVDARWTPKLVVVAPANNERS